MEFGRCFRCMKPTHGYPCPHCGYDPATRPAPEYALRPGTILNGKYVLGAVLGQGGFGITYIGWDLYLECPVAIKEYYPAGQVVRDSAASTRLQWLSTPQSHTARQEGQTTFLKEARKMSRVRDIPQVVHVQELFQENDTAYIAMDYVDGRTLTDFLLETGPMTWEQAAPVFLPAIRAMAEVHRAGIIHRDLSPDNLMLQSNGMIRLLDLGAAKDIQINSGTSSMQVAKRGFSPPEQYTQRGGTGPWSDVYAMGATLYYALTGEIPPHAIDRLDEDGLRWDLPQLQALPSRVLSALKHALVLNRKDRIQDMDQLLEELSQEKRRSPKFLLPLALGVAAAIACVCLIRPSGKQTPAPQPVETSQATQPLATLPPICDHVWLDPDCTNPQICQKCGRQQGQALGHTLGEATYNDPPTCIVCGAAEGEPKTPGAPQSFRSIVSRASASSVYSGDDLGEHGPENLYDGSLKTNWTEDVSGIGIGEYVVFSLKGTCAVNGLQIYTGSHLTKTNFRKNGRPSELLLTFSTGETLTVPLEDTYDLQEITFDRFYYTDSIKVTIQDVYTGTTYTDTVIAELTFVAYEP